MAATTGRFTSGSKKGWRWEIYEDSASPTGWVRKIWNPTDASSGGRPTEYFENYDYEADLEDERAITGRQQSQAATRAARDAQERAQRDAFATRDTEYRNSRLAYRDTRDRESDRRFNVGEERAERARLDRLDELRNALREQQRQFDLTYKREKDEADRQYQLEGQRLGADILKTGAGMRGALDFVQGDAYAQGVSAGGLSPWVNALRTGAAVPYGGGTATQGNPTPLTVGTLANSMTGQAAGGFDAFGRPRLSPGVQAAVDAGNQVFQKGLANQPLGFLENMTAEQRDGLRSIGGWLGRNVGAEEEYYRRSRPSQRSALLG